MPTPATDRRTVKTPIRDGFVSTLILASSIAIDAAARIIWMNDPFGAHLYGT